MTHPPQHNPDDDFQHWIDDLLTSSAVDSAAPASLHHRIENQYRSHKRRSYIWKSTLTLTAASIAFIAWSTQPTSSPNANIALSVAPQSDTPPIHDDTNINESPLEQPPAPKATFIARGDMITIPIASNDPQVTIVQVYNTTLTHRRWQQELAQQTINNTAPQPPSHGG